MIFIPNHHGESSGQIFHDFHSNKDRERWDGECLRFRPQSGAKATAWNVTWPMAVNATAALLLPGCSMRLCAASLFLLGSAVQPLPQPFSLTSVIWILIAKDATVAISNATVMTPCNETSQEIKSEKHTSVIGLSSYNPSVESIPKVSSCC
jgi:hypothetical protein